MKTLLILLIFCSAASAQQFHVGMTKKAFEDTLQCYHIRVLKTSTEGRIHPVTFYALDTLRRYNTLGAQSVKVDDKADTVVGVAWMGKGFNQRDYFDLVEEMKKEYGADYDHDDKNTDSWWERHQRSRHSIMLLRDVLVISDDSFIKQ